MNDVYTITGQTQADEIGPSGTIVPSMRVSFHVRHADVTGSISIPVSSYSADEVDRLVRAQADTINAVADL